MGLKWRVLLSFGICFCCSITCCGVNNTSTSSSNPLNEDTTTKTTYSTNHKVKSILMAPTKVLKSNETMMKEELDATKKKHIHNYGKEVEVVAEVLTEGYSYSGAKVDIKVWTPYVEKEDEYSTSRVLIQNDGFKDFELVETGWAADGSRTTGCFDLTCPGFVQVYHEIALGAAIYPIPKPYGLPYQITPHPQGSKNKQLVGELWPVNRHRLKGQDGTSPQMGNGYTPPAMYDTCGTMTRMRVEQNSGPLIAPEWSDVAVDEYRCYDILYMVDYVADPIFYYGGPGRSPWCP
ncbi:hypothetical protein L1987_81069 [Smallanthus sonchifolius]|uniref:Uncharacterized protein n=1 Tax=Smallanthus sonchifolius TaxID=185202 RepID=A0ACB8YNQ6_9ASTR|nr:hypothetical protein L1987_81069 [Smallanthus sonchifolius]